jgi:hypothetical protein
MVDCAVILSHRVTLGVPHRNLRVQKYRRSGFDENESPFLSGTRLKPSICFGSRSAPWQKASS